MTAIESLSPKSTLALFPWVLEDGYSLLQDEQSTGLEDLLVITALIRALRPNTIVETGSYKGIGTAAIWEAKPEHSRFVSIENDEALAKEASAWLRNSISGEAASAIVIADSTDPNIYAAVGTPIEFAFVDCYERIEAIEAMVPSLSPRCTIAVHDTDNTYPETDCYTHADIMAALGDRFNGTLLRTERGITILTLK